MPVLSGVLYGFIRSGWSGLFVLALSLAACTPPAPPAAMSHALIPVPASVEMAPSGSFIVTDSTVILVEPGNAEVARIGQVLAGLIRNRPDQMPAVAESATPLPGSIHLTTQGAADSLGAEGYALAVTPEQITLVAPQTAGLFYGMQTLRQLLPAFVEYEAAFAQPMPVPAVTVVDRPRFAWRGAMLDVARHFIPPADVRRFIDLMALYKLNRLHLHLSDDQGWRIEITARPNLTAHGGTTEVGGRPAGFYSQAEYRDLVAYAQARYITLVPEIDLPGHTNAALASYPELNCDGVAPDLYTGIEVGFSTVCVEQEATFRFVEDVVREIVAMTPGPWFHIGGDEVQKLTADQYRRFVERVQGIVQAHGKQVIGWDEIAHTSLLPGTLLQHWRPEGSQEGIAASVAKGAQVILSPANKVYLDMKYDSTTVLGLNWAGNVSVQTAYDWDPAIQLPGVSEAAIVGVEAPIWSETLRAWAEFEYMAFPRLPGVAEIGWSPAVARDWNTYRLRLGAQAPRWSALGINYYRAPEVAWTE
jgi:hexosaminidase